MFNNILNNPTLSGFTLARLHTDKNSNQRPVEYPDGWEHVAFPENANDPDEVPASYHRDHGFAIAAGFMKWHGGYVQRGVHFRKGQRYLAKVRFFINMSFHTPPPPADWQSHIQWRFIFNDAGHQVDSGWMQTPHGQFGQQEESLFVVESIKDGPMDFGLFFRSIYPSTSGEILINSIYLEEVPADYGSPVMIGNPDGTQTTPAISSSPAETITLSSRADDTQPSMSAARATETETGSVMGSATVSVDSLLDAMQDDDLQVIIAGFNAAAALPDYPEEVRQGFSRFAQVLERASRK